MSKKYSNKENFHYINPNYRMKFKDNYHAKDNKTSSNSEKNNQCIYKVNENLYEPVAKATNNESPDIPKRKANVENEFAFRGNCEMLEKYNYVPYYEKKNNSKN